MGVIVSTSVALEFNSDQEYNEVQESNKLRKLLTDNVHGINSSTLILNDGANDIAQADIEAFIDSLAAGDLVEYARTDGTRPFTGTIGGVSPSLGSDLATKSYVDSLLAGGGITIGIHETLDTLVHDLAEPYYLEVVRTNNKVSSITCWSDSTKTVKVRETIIARSAGKVSTITTTQFDGSGNTITNQTLTETITRSSGKVSAITVVEN